HRHLVAHVHALLERPALHRARHDRARGRDGGRRIRTARTEPLLGDAGRRGAPRGDGRARAGGCRDLRAVHRLGLLHGGRVTASILVVGSLAYDDVRTPIDSRDGVLGGAASYFAMAATRYAPVRLIGVVGDDFDPADVERLREQGVDLAGLERREGHSFRWKGTYDFSLDTAETI